MSKSTEAAQGGQWVTLHEQDIARIMEIEQRVYTHPWTQGNFLDSLRSGYACIGWEKGAELLGYMVVMPGVDEAHLLNVSVRPENQGQGIGGLLMHKLLEWARERHCEWVWLEVRASNVQAQEVYRHLGFAQVGRRPHYYPAWAWQVDQKVATREDALVMSYRLAS